MAQHAQKKFIKMTTGYLSQTTQHIINHKNDLNSISGLPDQADNIRKEAIVLLENSISSKKNIQKELQKSSVKILDGLQKALLSIDQNKEKALDYIDRSHDIAVLAQEKLDKELEQNADSKAAILNLSSDLTTVLRALQNQSEALKVEEQKAKNKADKFKKERYYFLALGPFGLAGLATATGLFVTWDAKAKDATRAASRVRNQINTLRLFQENINGLQQSFGAGIEVLSNVKNALSFLAGGIKNSIQNTHTTSEETVVLSLYLNAAIKEVQTLRIAIA